jgi:hypothetical protein
MLFVQATKQPGEIRIEATASELEAASATVQAEAAKLRPSI